MTTERQRIANRRNAARSTGPRSADGRGRTSQNAKRHGLTARPEPSEIENWLCIITDGADETSVPYPGDPDWPVVLRLAEAEAHLDRVRNYQVNLLVEDQAGPIMPNRFLGGMAQRAEEDLRLHRETGELSHREERSAQRIIRMSTEHYLQTIKAARTLRCRVQRYRAQAEARRTRALEDWLEVQKTKRTQFQP